jgi:regulatory protein
MIRRPPADRAPEDSAQAAYLLGLRWLGARELSSSQIRERLRRREFSDSVIDEALARLSAAGALDDARAARARAHHSARIQHRGRHRVLREIQALGVDRDTARAAVRETFDGVDEQTTLAELLARRLRARPFPTDRKEIQRLRAWLLRQGYDSAAIETALRQASSRDI